jgi:biopolymer transport protein ExbD
MAFHASHKHHTQPLAEINTTPLVDVMLVLLVIFIMTAPLLTQSLTIDLPETQQGNPATQQNVLRISIAADGSISLDDTPVSNDLQQRLSSAAARQPGAELQISADRATPYEKITEVMSHANTAGLFRIAFVTTPSVAPGASRPAAATAVPRQP